MITPDGSIKVTTAINEKMQKELSKTTYICAVTAIVVGALGVAAFLALYIIGIVFEKEDNDFFTMLILFAAVMGCGIGMLVLVKKAYKTVKNTDKVNCYYFYKDYFIIEEFLHGESVGKSKFYCNQVVKFKETAHYIFIYATKVTAFPVEKEGLTESELTTLRGIFSRSSRTAQSAPYPPQNPAPTDGGNPENGVGSGGPSPFDEFD